MENDEHDTNAYLINNVAWLGDHQKRAEAAGNIGWEYDSALSHDNWAVLRHRQLNKTLMAFRPTNWRKPRDLQADMDLVAGRLEQNKLYGEALDSRNKVATKYGQKPDLIGFSLGGTLAIKVGQATGDKVTAYNPGSNPFRRESVPSNVKVIRHSNDPISYGYSNLGAVKHYTGLWKYVDPLQLATSYDKHHIEQATKTTKKRRQK